MHSDRYFCRIQLRQKLEWMSDFLLNCFSEHYLTFLLQTKNWTSHDIFMEVTFLLAHTCRFSLELLCCDNCWGPIFGSCRYDFNGLELAHTVQFLSQTNYRIKRLDFYQTHSWCARSYFRSKICL